jgi:hypothetical protein
MIFAQVTTPLLAVTRPPAWLVMISIALMGVSNAFHTFS